MHRIISIVKRDSFATNDREYRCYEFVTSAITKINDRDHGWLKGKTMFWSCKISSRSSFSSQFFPLSLSLFLFPWTGPTSNNDPNLTMGKLRARWQVSREKSKTVLRILRPPSKWRGSNVAMMVKNKRAETHCARCVLSRSRGPMDILAYRELRCVMHQYRDSCVLLVTLNTNIESNKSFLNILLKWILLYLA